MNIEKLKNLFTKPNKKQFLFIAISFLIIGLLVLAILLSPIKEPIPELPNQEADLEIIQQEEIQRQLQELEEKRGDILPPNEEEIQRQLRELEELRKR